MGGWFSIDSCYLSGLQVGFTDGPYQLGGAKMLRAGGCSGSRGAPPKIQVIEELDCSQQGLKDDEIFSIVSNPSAHTVKLMYTSFLYTSEYILSPE